MASGKVETEKGRESGVIDDRPTKRARVEGEDALDDDDEDQSAPRVAPQASDLYLDTVCRIRFTPSVRALCASPQINRAKLDFDFEKVCSVSLSNINTYGCLVCGKYFQGRGRSSYAYAHSIHEDHHVFINLETTKVGHSKDRPQSLKHLDSHPRFMFSQTDTTLMIHRWKTLHTFYPRNLPRHTWTGYRPSLHRSRPLMISLRIHISPGSSVSTTSKRTII